MRKSSRRSDQRIPPLATGPPRRWTASVRGEYTNTSNMGRGLGSDGTWEGSSLNDRYGLGWPSWPVWKWLVRRVASTTPRKLRRIRSSSRLATWSIDSASSSRSSSALASASSGWVGSKRAWNSSTSQRAMWGLLASACSMYSWLKVSRVWRRYLQ